MHESEKGINAPSAKKQGNGLEVSHCPVFFIQVYTILFHKFC